MPRYKASGRRNDVLVAGVLEAAFADLVCEHGPEPFPPEPDRFMSGIEAPFVEQVFHVPKRERKAHKHRHSKTRNFARTR